MSILFYTFKKEMSANFDNTVDCIKAAGGGFIGDMKLVTGTYNIYWGSILQLIFTHFFNSKIC